ncbi:MAG: DUF1385 domain-containing protein [Armatimonadota bacterium]
MHDKSIGIITRNIKTINPTDTVNRAIEIMHASGIAILPVVDAGRIAGLVTEASLLGAVLAGDPEAVKDQPVSSFMEECNGALFPWTPLVTAGEIMKQHDLQVIPVVDESGGYLGIVTRTDLLGALSLSLKPPTVAGMATPLGVYLTTGSHRAGAGDLGLFLAGVAIMLMNFASLGMIFGIAWLAQKITPLNLLDIMTSVSTNMPGWAYTVRGLMFGLSLPIFLLLMRIMPLSGYHAAEHQVVHAIESGEPLRPANVMHMLRVHPRCGTNIVAAMIVFLMVSQIIGTDIALMVTVLILVFAWRSIGGYFQYYVTTKTPNSRQLENGIKAGEKLLAQFRENPSYNIRGWRRIWNTGMPQVMLGAAVTTLAVQFLNLLPAGSF